MRTETNHRDQNNQANGRKQNRIIKSHAVMLAASHGFVKSWFLQLLQLLQRAHLGTTTIVEASRSLSLRGTSGERAGERGTFHRIGAAIIIGIPSLPYPLPTPPSWGEGIDQRHGGFEDAPLTTAKDPLGG